MAMFFNKSMRIFSAGLFVVALGSGHAKTFQLKKVMIINENGSGGFLHPNQINFTSSYINTYLNSLHSIGDTFYAANLRVETFAPGNG